MAPVLPRGLVSGTPSALTVTNNPSSNWTLVAANVNSLGMFSASGAAVAAGGVTINVQFAYNAEL